MSLVKNFGLIGVGSEIQFSKGGVKIKNDTGTFKFRNAADNADVAAQGSALTASTGDITASTGDIVATLGNMKLSNASAVLTISDASLSRQAANVLKFNGTSAFIAPAGTTGNRPGSAVLGMTRLNTDVSDAARLEYYDGDGWQQSVVASGIVPMSGTLNMNNNRITGLANPQDDQDAATKFYVDNAVEGIHWKAAVNVLGTVNVPLTGTFPLVIDSYTIDVTDVGYRILLTNQNSSASDPNNGIYVVQNPSGSNYSLVRAEDANTPVELRGASVFVLGGTQYAGTAWVQINHYLLSSFASQSWVQFAGGNTYKGGNGITVSGVTISANTDGVTLYATGAGGSKLAVKSSASSGQTLISQGTDVDAAWGALDLGSANAVTGTLPVARGGTGSTTYTAGRVIFASSTALTENSSFTYTTNNSVLTSGTLVLTGSTNSPSINATSGNITLSAAAGNATISSATNNVVLSASAGAVSITSSNNVVFNLPSTATFRIVDIAGPTAAQYSGALTDTGLTNKYYVDQSVSGNISGAIKAVKATVSLATNTSVNIGAAIPANSTILKVIVSVTSAATGSTTLQVGKSAGAQYMTTTENHLQTTGIYIADCFVTEATSTQIQATIASGTSGSATVLVQYQLP